MRLVQPRKEESVYVTLSDLLLTTVAIFVLLLLMVMAQLKPPAPAIPDLRDEVARLQQELGRSQEALGNALRKEPVELVIAIDTSGSMKVPLDNLKAAIKRLALELPKLTELRIGIVAYGGNDRDGINRPSREFALRSIAPPPAGARDLRYVDPALRRFLEGDLAELSGGSVDVEAAVATALGYFERHGKPEARKAFALIGDVGPYERHGTGARELDYNRRSPIDRRYEAGVYEQVRRFVAAHESASVLSMYTGYHTPPGHGSYDVIRYTQPYSPNFFQQVSAVAGERGTYAEDPGDILSMLLLAMIAAKK